MYDMLSLGIVIPSWHYYADPFQPQPLNELYFATLVDAHFGGVGVEVDVIDLRVSPSVGSRIDIDSATASIPEHDIFFYWVMKAADFNEIVAIVERLRRSYPGAKHVAGGTQIENLGAECKEYFDVTISGPGEGPLIEIVEDTRVGSLREDYVGDWGASGYDRYPFPRREYLPYKSIVNKQLFRQYGAVSGTSVLFSRGCCFKCAYCVYNVPNVIQRRSPQSIEDEIQYLKREYGVRAVNLRDEICIPLSRTDSIPFIKTMARQDIMWRGQTRVLTDKEILSHAHESGCVELAIGVESVSQEVLDIVKKAQNLAQVREMIATCKEIGIKVKMCLILGLPGEPRNILELTRRFVEETQPDYVSVSGFCPVPGSEVFNKKEQYGIRYIDQDWSKHAHLMFRYSDDEDHGLPFEYAETSQWGDCFSRQEIKNNILELQHYLQAQGMSY